MTRLFFCAGFQTVVSEVTSSLITHILLSADPRRGETDRTCIIHMTQWTENRFHCCGKYCPSTQSEPLLWYLSNKKIAVDWGAA